MYTLIEEITKDVSELSGLLDNLNGGHTKEYGIVQSSIQLRRFAAGITTKIMVLRKAVNQHRINLVQDLQTSQDAQKELEKNERIVELKKELAELEG